MDQIKVKIINHPPREEIDTLLTYFPPEIISAAALLSFSKLSFEEQLKSIKKVNKHWNLFSISGYINQMWLAKRRGEVRELENIRTEYLENCHLTEEEKSELEVKYNEIIKDTENDETKWMVAL